MTIEHVETIERTNLEDYYLISVYQSSFLALACIRKNV